MSKEMKKYTVVIDSRNRHMVNEVKTVIGIEAIIRHLEKEVRPQFPVAKVAISCGEMRVNLVWDVERKQEKEEVKVVAQPAKKEYVFVVQYRYMMDGKYTVVTKEIGKSENIKKYQKYLQHCGGKEVVYEILDKKEKNWRRMGK